MDEQILIRQAEIDDAEQLLAHIKTLTNEWPNNLLWAPGEITLTVEQEREFIRDHQRSGLLLVAEHHGMIVGGLTIGVPPQRKARHVGGLGIAIQKEYRGIGLGRRMMKAALEWARSRGLHRVELSVYTRNVVGVKLYQSVGFEIEGTKRHSMCEDGEYFDEYYMSILL